MRTAHRVKSAHEFYRAGLAGITVARILLSCRLAGAGRSVLALADVGRLAAAGRAAVAQPVSRRHGGRAGAVADPYRGETRAGLSLVWAGGADADVRFLACHLFRGAGP